MKARDINPYDLTEIHKYVRKAKRCICHPDSPFHEARCPKGDEPEDPMYSEIDEPEKEKGD